VRQSFYDIEFKLLREIMVLELPKIKAIKIEPLKEPEFKEGKTTEEALKDIAEVSRKTFVTLKKLFEIAKEKLHPSEIEKLEEEIKKLEKEKKEKLELAGLLKEKQMLEKELEKLKGVS